MNAIKRFTTLMLVTLLLVACAPVATPTAAPTEAPQATDAPQSNTEPTTAAPVEISWMVFETPALTASFWDGVIAQGIKDSGVPGLTVQKLVTPGADRTAYAKQLIAAGTEPDLMQSISTQDLVDSGFPQPWDQNWSEEYHSLPMADSIKGKSWQAPTNSQIIPFVFYNKDLFKQAGVEVPKTWSEFQTVIEKPKATGIKPLQLVGAGDG